MQQTTTIVQYIAFRPGVSFDNPGTPNGRSWNIALKKVSQTQGWSSLHWGSRRGQEEVADLLITWLSHADLLQFMGKGYHTFLEDIATLGASDGHVSQQPTPFIVGLDIGIPSLELGAVSSIYELEFDPTPSADTKIGLHIDTQICRSLFIGATEECAEPGQFLGMDTCWIAEHPATPPPDQTLPALPHSKLLLITEWASLAGETRLLDEGKPPITTAGQTTTTTAGAFFTNNILQPASRYTNHHVMFENINASNVAWLDKEEKWSVHMTRLIRAEDQRRTG